MAALEKVEGKTKHGGRRPGSGRKKGTPNKATADVKAAAQQYTTQAIDALAHVMLHGESEAARVAAADKLLDRGHGKANQEHKIEAGESLLNLVHEAVKLRTGP
jgi:hypothetical protein